MIPIFFFAIDRSPFMPEDDYPKTFPAFDCYIIYFIKYKVKEKIDSAFVYPYPAASEPGRGDFSLPARSRFGEGRSPREGG
jgi:hypothetical protein